MSSVIAPTKVGTATLVEPVEIPIFIGMTREEVVSRY
jgi:hypothetical protein